MSQYSKTDRKFKDFEKRFSDVKLLNKIPAVIRLDGKAFHTYTRYMKKPFSDVLHDAFVEASINTVKKMDGACAVYTQSDEVSIWLCDTMNTETMGWFDWKIQKLVSVASSLFTYYFNEAIGGINEMPAFFDARAFNLPTIKELNEYFVWRQNDATKNSISMLAQSEFSHNELQRKNASNMQDMLMTEKGINWNDLEVWKKRGSLIVKVEETSDVEYVDKRTKETVKVEGVKRKKWKEVPCPIFTKQSIDSIVNPS
jgi:tRNA(His) 5'-end guanylyltransferase